MPACFSCPHLSTLQGVLHRPRGGFPPPADGGCRVWAGGRPHRGAVPPLPLCLGSGHPLAWRPVMVRVVGWRNEMIGEGDDQEGGG